MKRAGRLMEQVLDRETLREAYARAARGKRTKRTRPRSALRLDENLAELARDLAEGTYAVGPYHQFTIFDPKERMITAPCFRDRVLHHALTLVCEPVFERFLIADTFACRRGKGREAAVERAKQFARRYPWFLKLDIRKYFDSIEHERSCSGGWGGSSRTGGSSTCSAGSSPATRSRRAAACRSAA